MITAGTCDSFKEELLKGIHDFTTDTFKVALYTNSATLGPATTVYTTVNETSGFGYTAGGNPATTASATQTGGVYKLTLNNPASWTATGSGFTFRYAILWDSTTSTPVAYWDYGSSQFVDVGEVVSVVLDSVNGVFTAT